MSVGIRVEDARDADGIRRVLESAFGSPAEADLVERLRRDGDLVISRVAEDEGQIVGHVAFSRLHVEDGEARHPALALAPLAVAPDRWRQGIGSRLVRAGHAAAVAAGERLIVVLGEPSYYGRFGYERAAAEGFESAYRSPYLQALALGPAWRTGRLVYAPAFDAL